MIRLQYYIYQVFWKKKKLCKQFTGINRESYGKKYVRKYVRK